MGVLQIIQHVLVVGNDRHHLPGVDGQPFKLAQTTGANPVAGRVGVSERWSQDLVVTRPGVIGAPAKDLLCVLECETLRTPDGDALRDIDKDDPSGSDEDSPPPEAGDPDGFLCQTKARRSKFYSAIPPLENPPPSMQTPIWRRAANHEG